MKRTVMSNIEQWKNQSHRKPLILNGARQVGKTWLLQEFGRRNFKKVAYINLDGNEVMRVQFDRGYDLPRLLDAIQIQSRVQIQPADTLIILDEIQEVPSALTSLKYFYEQMPELAIAAAGSLLGLTVHSGTGYPVGKVQTIDVYPLTFLEYLQAVQEPGLRELIMKGDPDQLRSFASDLIAHLRNYYFVGGMPEVVATFAERRNYSEARELQKQILDGYERDISKHLPQNVTENALAVWKSIPTHLGQENKRFVFGHIREGARASQYRDAITWLTQAGLTTRVPMAAVPALPLASYADEKNFKLFLLDIGLLGAMARVDASTILEGDALFVEFKGSLSEQYVCQQLCAEGFSPYYWKASNARAEVDFLLQSRGDIYAIEVKAAENLKSKSLRAFHDKYPETEAVRFSLSGFRRESWMINVPLFAVQNQRLWSNPETRSANVGK